MRATTGDRPKHIGDERMQYYTCQPGSTQPTRVNPEKPGRPTTIVASQFFSRYAIHASRYKTHTQLHLRACQRLPSCARK